MFCPRCGKPAEIGEGICSNCGLNLQAINPAANAGSEDPQSDIQIIIERLSTLNIKMIIIDIFAITVLILSFMAAYQISNAGGQIMQIRTSAGQTLNEVYDRQMGNVYVGFALFVRACGIFFFSVLISLGFKSKNKSKS